MRFSGAVLASVLAVLGLLGVVGPLLADGASLDSSEQDLVARINSFRGLGASRLWQSPTRSARRRNGCPSTWALTTTSPTPRSTDVLRPSACTTRGIPHSAHGPARTSLPGTRPPRTS